MGAGEMGRMRDGGGGLAEGRSRRSGAVVSRFGKAGYFWKSCFGKVRAFGGDASSIPFLLWKQLQEHPLLPCTDLSGGIHLEAADCRPADSGNAKDQACSRVRPEMLRPLLPAWMIQSVRCLGFWIESFKVVGFVQVARAAGQRPIRFLVRLSATNRYDMLDFKGEIEHGFGSPAVFAAMRGARRHPGVAGIH